MGMDRKAARWVLAPGAKKIILSTGSSFAEPEPMAIWEAEFDGRTEISGLAVSRPSDDLPEIEFSRFPIEISITASGSTARGMQIALTGMLDGKLIELSIPPPSQIVSENNWGLVELDALDEITRSLSGKGISPSKRINVGQLIWLRGKDRLPVPFQDQTEETDASIAVLPKIDAIGLREGTALYPYQETGVAFLASVARESLGCVLADEMGLGKTLQVIALLSIEIAAKRKPNLIICPATLLENWRRELSAFAPHLNVFMHSGPQRPGNPAALNNFDVVLSSYDTAVRDEPMLSSLRWNVLALDEAQNIKNPRAQRAIAVKKLPRRVSIAVTGTPVENRLTDLWSISDFALPQLLGSQEDFEAAFDDSHEDATKLAPIVAPILLRRRVADVAKDLPPRIDVPQAISMTRNMAELYEGVRQEIAASHGKSATLVTLGKLRQFCSHPRLLDIPWTDPSAGMPKYERLLEILEEIFSRDQKALIFASFTEMADILNSDIPKRFPGAFAGIIDGRVPVAERQPLVDSFSSHKGFGFLALNPKAAGVGLNITAANHVIHYNPEWNPAVEDQASARAYRRKQTLPVTIHHLYFVDTVEEVVVDRLDIKRRIAGGAVVGHNGSTDASDIARALQISPLAHQDLLQ
jgi:SNF2 family DNA or RNA helicase